MRLIGHVTPIVSALVVILAPASASASSVTVTSSGAKTAAATTGSRVSWGGPSGSQTMNCTGSQITATFSSSATTRQFSANGQFTFTGCQVAGGVPVSVSCTSGVRLAATSATASGVTSMYIDYLGCTMRVSSVCSAYLVNPFSATYTNATSRISLHPTDLTVINSSNGFGGQCSLLPNSDIGAADLSNNVGGALLYTVSPTTTITAT